MFYWFSSDLPPPPPEAYDDHDGDHNGDRDGDSKQIQSRTFRMLQDAVDHGGRSAFFSDFLVTCRLH